MPISSFLEYVQSHSKVAARKKEEQAKEESEVTRHEEEEVANRTSAIHPRVVVNAGFEEQFSNRGNDGLKVMHIASATALVKRVMKRVVTYNLNSMIAAIGRKEGHLLDFIKRDRADVYNLQEIMIDPNQKLKGEKWRLLPFMRRVKLMGYHSYWHPGTRNGGGYGGIVSVASGTRAHSAGHREP